MQCQTGVGCAHNTTLCLFTAAGHSGGGGYAREAAARFAADQVRLAVEKAQSSAPTTVPPGIATGTPTATPGPALLTNGFGELEQR